MSKILLIIDAQNVFNNSIYTDKKLKQIRDYSLKNDYDLVIASRFINTEDSPFYKYMNMKDGLEIEETKIYEGIKFDKEFIKKGFSIKEIIDKYLKEDDEVHIIGCDTDSCILYSSCEILENNIKPLVIKNLCFSSGGYIAHRRGLKCIKRSIGKDNLIKN